MQRSALCRPRRELSNAYLLAKFRFDAAENEPSKICRYPPVSANCKGIPIYFANWKLLPSSGSAKRPTWVKHDQDLSCNVIQLLAWNATQRELAAPSWADSSLFKTDFDQAYGGVVSIWNHRLNGNIKATVFQSKIENQSPNLENKTDESI